MTDALSPNIFKGLIVFFLSSFVPVTAVSFLLVRRAKKTAEFARVVDMLGMRVNVAEFARSRVAEQYAAQDYRISVLFAWLMSILGFVSLLFGADLVDKHEGKVNFLLTGTSHLETIAMQTLRIDSMVVMSLAFLGAFVWSAQNILYRLNAGDLAPSVYFSTGIRMTLAPVLALMISHLVMASATLDPLRAGLPAIAFLIGWFPDRALLFLKESFPSVFRDDRSAHELPLSMIEGVSAFDRAKLTELGIADAQNLANANFIELVVRTAFSPGQIIDWIGQAQLYVYFKDDVVALRQHQIRTVFDMLPVGRDSGLLEALAATTRLDATGMRLFCNSQADTPAVEQLLVFQSRLGDLGPALPGDGGAVLHSNVVPRIAGAHVPGNDGC